MKLSNALAGLKCPACATLQKPAPLLRTMKGDDDWVAYVASPCCGSPLRIRFGDCILFTVSSFAGLCVAAWIAGVLPYTGEGNLPAFYSPDLLEAILRFTAYLGAIIWIVLPISARILSVEISS